MSSPPGEATAAEPARLPRAEVWLSEENPPLPVEEQAASSCHIRSRRKNGSRSAGDRQPSRARGRMSSGVGWRSFRGRALPTARRHRFDGPIMEAEELPLASVTDRP